jgi:FKBP-type peptidyl-prolyl cis-trans isomerase FkpA
MHRYLLFLLLLVSFGCGNDHPQQVVVTKGQLEKPLIRENKRLLKKEAEAIDAYLERHHWVMDTTGTGLRYMIYQHGTGELATAGKKAKVNFTVSLLDGTVCYSSKQTGPEEFVVWEDHVESGLHEGIILMHVGDKARFILPAHLAHGLLGDEQKIPPLSTIVYDVELLELK